MLLYGSNYNVIVSGSLRDPLQYLTGPGLNVIKATTLNLGSLPWFGVTLSHII